MTATVLPLEPVVSLLEPPSAEPNRAELGASRRRELGDFLRNRRERITPAQVGLHSGGRRRTPGLRREEVAQLSGLGVTWYTWLEQGRDIRASQQVLEAIARTLQLDRHERSHLFTLADSPVVAAVDDSHALGPEIHALLTQLDPFPVSVINARYDVLAWNGAYARVSGDLATLPVEERNGLWLAFTSPYRRSMMVDFDESVGRMIALYRAAMAEHVGEPSWRGLVQRLSEVSPAFVELWDRHDIVAPENLTKRLLHPELGLLHFVCTNLWLDQHRGLRLMTYTPLDEATREAMNRVYEVSAPSLL
jgi:hypothetical protein